jgi:hypothetical protein
MRKLLLVSLVAAVGVVAGCKDQTKEIEALADRACACKDAACANKVIDDMVAWVHDNENARGDEQRAEKAGERLAKCAIAAGVDPVSLQTKFEKLSK